MYEDNKRKLDDYLAQADLTRQEHEAALAGMISQVSYPAVVISWAEMLLFSEFSIYVTNIFCDFLKFSTCFLYAEQARKNCEVLQDTRHSYLPELISDDQAQLRVEYFRLAKICNFVRNAAIVALYKCFVNFIVLIPRRKSNEFMKRWVLFVSKLT